MGYGIVELSDGMLIKLLQLEGARLEAVQWDVKSKVLILGLRHPVFLEPKEGITTSSTKLTYVTKWCGHNCDLGMHEVVTCEPLLGSGVTTQEDLP